MLGFAGRRSVSTAAATHCQKVLQEMRAKGGLDQTLAATAFVLESASASGDVTASFHVLPVHLNRLGALHGAVLCYLVDMCGSLAVAARGNRESLFTGVSTDIHTTFVRGVKVDEVLRVHASCVNHGRNLAYTRTTIYRAADEKVVAFGSHSKFIKGLTK